MLENLPANILPRLLRRTTISALLVAVVAFVGCLVLGWAMGALGVAIGFALAILNLRFLDRQAAKVELSGEENTKVLRRQLGGRTAIRLISVTAGVLVAFFLSAPLGIGIVAGLVLYQIVFVMNVLRVMAGSGGIQ